MPGATAGTRTTRSSSSARARPRPAAAPAGERLEERRPPELREAAALTRACVSWASRRRSGARPVGRPTPPLPSVVGLHGDVDAASATLSAAWPRPSLNSAVPDVLAPGLRCVFCGINPGRVSAAAAAHFANPRNDFWRLLHDAGLHAAAVRTRRSSSRCSTLGYGVTNAAYRTTPGSGDLRRGDFDAARLERVARRARAARDRVRRQGGLPRRCSASAPSSGRSARTLGDDGALRPAVDVAGERRRAVRRAPALVPRAARVAASRCRARRCGRCVVDADERVLLLRCEQSGDGARPGGSRRAAAIEPGRATRRRRSGASCARSRVCDGFALGPLVWRREHVLPLGRGSSASTSSFHLVRVDRPEAQPDDRPRGRACRTATAGGRSPSSRRRASASGRRRSRHICGRSSGRCAARAARPASLAFAAVQEPSSIVHLLAAIVWVGGSTSR